MSTSLPDRLPTYSYIRDTYGVDPVVGARIRVDGKLGTITEPTVSHQHYVAVILDELPDNVTLWHPTWRVDYKPKVSQ